MSVSYHIVIIQTHNNKYVGLTKRLSIKTRFQLQSSSGMSVSKINVSKDRLKFIYQFPTKESNRKQGIFN